MKIILITDLFPLDDSFNDARTLFDFAREWTKNGHYVEVIRPNFLFNTFIRNKQNKKTGIYFYENIKIYNLNFYTPFLFNIEKKIPKELNIDDFDAVISHMPSGTLFAQRLLQKCTIAWTVSVHSSDIEVLTNPLYKIYFSSALKKAYLHADSVSPRSLILKNKIESILPSVKDKTFTAFSGIEENCIENKEFYIDKAISFKNKDKIKFLTAASLIKRKRIDIIFKALSSLEFKNWEYTIIGSGNEEKYLKKSAKNLNISDKITFIPKTSRDNVLNIMKTSDIFLLLSEKETFGMVYLEALSKGCFVFARKNDGIDGILQDKQNSFLCSDSKELAEALQYLLNMNRTVLEQFAKNVYDTVQNCKLSSAAKNYIENLKLNI